MKPSIQQKSTVEEIRARFDHDVERFSNVETGQSATMDAPLAMELITQAALAITPEPGRILDLGCGAGNNSLKLLSMCTNNPDCDLLDLSPAMVERAIERVAPQTEGSVRGWVGDLRTVDLPPEGFDVIFAAAVLHHLREDADWDQAFTRLYSWLKPGGSLWITDLVAHGNPAVQKLMWERYGDYLEELGGEDYRKEVFEYIEIEDSPRPVPYQLDLLRKVGFEQVELLHKNSCFAAFGGVKR